MNNNKNRVKDRPKSNPELRQIKPKEFADAGILGGKTIGVHSGGHEKKRTDTEKDPSQRSG
jgi:hypothetical protein